MNLNICIQKAKNFYATRFHVSVAFAIITKLKFFIMLGAVQFDDDFNDGDKKISNITTHGTLSFYRKRE